jgi:hypothetical protein
MLLKHYVAGSIILDGELNYRLGKKASAADSYLDALRLGIDLPSGGSYVSFLVGISCEALSRRALWSGLDQLDAAMARKVTIRLEQLALKRTELAESLLEEKRMGVATLPEMIRRSDEDNETFLVPHTQKIIANVASWMDQTVANLCQPYKLREDIPIPIDPMSQVVLPHYKTAGFFEARNLCGDTQIATALALHTFRIEHHTYPASLVDLVPSYLPKLPADPFGSGETLRYRVTNGRYVLYSIGPDGKDDMGNAIEDKTRTGISRYAIHLESKGDVVAGVNF